MGKSVTLSEMEEGEALTLEVGCCATLEEHDLFHIEHYWPQNGVPNCILVSEAAMKKLCGEPSVQNIIIDCEPEAESRVRAGVEELTAANPSVSYTIIKSQYVEEFKTTVKSVYILGGAVSVILLSIGMINFINVMLTGVFVRRRELAVLESVGMTKKQLKRMIVYEGICYGAVTLALVFTLGNAVIYLVAGLSRQSANYAVFHYPLLAMCLLSAAIMAICILVPAIVCRMVSRESITERRRAVE